eukprot:Nitzschia sp. Nitz4//scaffold34_size148208//54081//55607//NITZ4_002975-RA/size148208-processed-gene-0.40-mRNA-1//-1//CDS//3329548780//4843//frame0
MSDDDGSWDESGAFPTSSESSKSRQKNHIFTDEPFEGEYYASLEVVNEGSRENTADNSEPSTEGCVAVSTTSSETPAVDNTADTNLRRVKMAQQQQNQQTTQQVGKNTNASPSAVGVYPFNIYQSLTKFDQKKNFSDPGGVKPSSSYVSVSTRGSNQRKADSEEASMPSPIAPMSVGEESSVISDQQSQVMEAVSLQAPNSSVMSARSRRQSKRSYTIRHTLSTTQQVNAHPATMLRNLFIGVEQERHMHKLAAQNLRAVHNWILFFPSILLTLLSGVGVFILEAELNISENAQVYCSIIVGVMAVVSVFWQALSKMLDLGTRGSLHSATASALKRLSEDILLTLSASETVPAEYVALVSEKFAQALDACPSTVPYKLEAAYTTVSDRMVLMLKPPMGQPPRKNVHKLDYMRLYATAYDELSTEIIHHWTWPLTPPPPRSASEAALRSFKTIVTEGREAVRPNRGCFGLFLPCMSGGEVERSLFDVVPHHTEPGSNYPVRTGPFGQEV